MLRMNTTAGNIIICHKCRYRQQAGGACLIDEANIVTHAKADYCPKKKYGDGARPEGFGEPVHIPPRPAKAVSADAVKVIEMEERGFGNDVESFAKAIGADRLAKLYEELTGWGCGCPERKRLLNKLPSLAKSWGWIIGK